jgi:hypothetical protein
VINASRSPRRPPRRDHRGDRRIAITAITASWSRRGDHRRDHAAITAS